jgi:hypothetical protein
VQVYMLLRFRPTKDKLGIIGSLMKDSGSDVKSICRTYELPWRDNERNISCIPSGIYDCRIRYSSTKGRSFEVLNVKDRSDILIHVGNTHVDTEGCILVGLDALDNSIARSRQAMGELLIKLPDTFRLIIRDCYKGE